MASIDAPTPFYIAAFRYNSYHSGAMQARREGEDLHSAHQKTRKSKKNIKIRLQPNRDKNNSHSKKQLRHHSEHTKHKADSGILLDPLSLPRKPSQSIHKKSSTKWKMIKSNDLTHKPAALPDISEARTGPIVSPYETSAYTSNKKVIFNPPKVLKIPFQELVPVKEVSRQERMVNLRRIRDEFSELVNTSNKIAVNKGARIFRAYVEKGNNGSLVRQAIQKRWWWHLQDKHPRRADLYWSQWFNQAYIEDMPELQAPTGQPTEYSRRVSAEEPRINSIKMILDQTTFSRIQPRITLRDEHYLRLNRRRLTQATPEAPEVSADNSNCIHNHVDGCLQLHSKKLLFKNLYRCNQQGVGPFRVHAHHLLHGGPPLALLRTFPGPLRPARGPARPGDQQERVDHQAGGEQQLRLRHHSPLFPGRDIIGVEEEVRRGQEQRNSAEVHLELFPDIWAEVRPALLPASDHRQRAPEGLLVQRRLHPHLFLDLRPVGHQQHDGAPHQQRSPEERGFLRQVRGLQQNDLRQLREVPRQAWPPRPSLGPGLRADESHSLRPGGGSQSQNKEEAVHFRGSYLLIQLFGLDYMLDDRLRPILIEANSNPALQTGGIILGKLIPELVDNTLMTAVDPLYPPPDKGKPNEYLSKDYFRSNKFELIFADSPN